jgi:hypothetical protein
MQGVTVPDEKERNWTRLNYIVWSLVILVTVAGWVSLERLRSQLEQAEEKIGEAELLTAQLGSQMDAYDAAARESLQYIEMETERLTSNQESIARLCRMDRNGQNPTIASLCANLEYLGSGNDYSKFLQIETKAASERGAGEFAASLETYGEALTELATIENLFIGNESEYDLKRMTLLEGQAFGLYRLDRLEEARTRLDQALALEDIETRAVSGFVYSTDLKVRCEQDIAGSQASRIYEQYQRQLANVRELEASRIDAGSVKNKMTALQGRFWREYRTDDEKYFRQDKELKIVCGLN